MAVYGYISHSEDGVLCHHGVKGQKWGIRRYQNADGTLTAEGRKRYGISRKPGSFQDWGDDISNLRENRIFRRARRDKYRQYIEDAKKGEFFKNYKRTNKAFDSVVDQAIREHRKQYTPEELYNRQWKQKYIKNILPATAVYGTTIGGAIARKTADAATRVKWNTDRRNPYKDSNKLLERNSFINSSSKVVRKGDKIDAKKTVSKNIEGFYKNGRKEKLTNEITSKIKVDPKLGVSIHDIWDNVDNSVSKNMSNYLGLKSNNDKQAIANHITEYYDNYNGELTNDILKYYRNKGIRVY